MNIIVLENGGNIEAKIKYGQFCLSTISFNANSDFDPDQFDPFSITLKIIDFHPMFKN